MYLCVLYQSSDGGVESGGGKLRDHFQLDSCLIRVDPQLAVALEHIRYPQNLIKELGLDVDFNEDGLVIAGTFISSSCTSSGSISNNCCSLR